MSKSSGKTISTGYIAIFATVVIWSTPSLFQFYLIPYVLYKGNEFGSLRGHPRHTVEGFTA